MKVGIVGLVRSVRPARSRSCCGVRARARGGGSHAQACEGGRDRYPYGVPVGPIVGIQDGDYQDLAGAALVMVTAGVNEKSGGATDRATIRPAASGSSIPTSRSTGHHSRVVKAAPEAVLLVVTDPPDPLADVTRRLARHDRVLSTGTFSTAYVSRAHRRTSRRQPGLGRGAGSRRARHMQVFLWSSARVAGVPVLKPSRTKPARPGFPDSIERDVRYANITIIEGNDASQFGIGMVCARLAEIVLHDERAAIPIGSFHANYGVTFSLPTIVGRHGAVGVIEPDVSEEERFALQRSADTLNEAAERAARGLSVRHDPDRPIPAHGR